MLEIPGKASLICFLPPNSLNRMRRHRLTSLEEKRRRILAIADRLAEEFPDLKVPLHHQNAFELLIATILSAQCTDEAVNRVTPELFKNYPTPQHLAQASLKAIERIIRSLGLFRSKANAIRECSRQLIERHSGQVPGTMEELTQLRGVGRKTANVILGHAFGVPGIIVDTHAKRLARRLGVTKETDPNKIEKDLMRLLPAEKWTSFSHRLILHGRRICHARRTDCEICPLNDLCPSSSARLRKPGFNTEVHLV